MQRRLRWFFCAAVFALTACSHLPHVGVYKLEINQGNYVTQDMVERLKPDMTRGQVKLVLGTPLVTDAFHADRWDYVYYHGVDGRLVEKRNFAVYFANDKLAKWEGDQAPPAPSYRPSEPGEGKTKAEEEKGFFGKLRDKLGF